MRNAALALITVCAVTACNPGAPAGGGAFPDLSSASYRAESTAYAEDGQAMPIVMIRSGNKVRMEMVQPQGQMAAINNGDTGESFVLITQDGRTMAMQASAENYSNPTEEWNAEFSSTATRTGDCAVAGENGAEWTRQTETNTTNTACVTNDGIILRATENGRTTWETQSVQRGPQSADLFVLPPGVQVVDLGAMMGPAAPQGGGGTAQMCATLRNAGAPADTLERAGC